MRFSIIVVCLNAGQRLEETIDSILKQTYSDYEVIIKDGMSTDGSIEALINKNEVASRAKLCEEGKKISYQQTSVNIYRQQDKSIYDAMNQAIKYANGEYYIFLNAGDIFYDEKVLSNVQKEVSKLSDRPDIFYGNLYHKTLKSVVNSSPEINDFTCYRNVPCHQTCFYSKKMFEDRGYNPEYNVRADYEHFLYCFYERKANIQYVSVTICVYEGGGYSETEENKRKSAMQHREIVVRYMGKKKANHYRRVMRLTLQPLRTKMAESEKFSKIYNAIKRLVYSK